MGRRKGRGMGRMLTQPVLALLPGDAREIASGVGAVTGEDGGGLVTVHGLATFAWDGGDEAGRRLAAVQLVRLRVASPAQVATAFGGAPATVWRWDKALAGGGVAGLVPARRGPKGATKLTEQLAGRIAGLDAQGMTLRQIAAAAGVSTFTVRAALGRIPARGQDQAGESGSGGQPEPDAQLSGPEEVSGQGDDDDRQDEPVPVLPDPLPPGGERALSRFGLLGEGAQPLFKAGPGIRWPGCCWHCPLWRQPGCPAARGRSTGG